MWRHSDGSCARRDGSRVWRACRQLRSCRCTCIHVYVGPACPVRVLPRTSENFLACSAAVALQSGPYKPDWRLVLLRTCARPQFATTHAARTPHSSKQATQQPGAAQASTDCTTGRTQPAPLLPCVASTCPARSRRERRPVPTGLCAGSSETPPACARACLGGSLGVGAGAAEAARSQGTRGQAGRQCVSVWRVLCTGGGGGGGGGGWWWW
jgi:hypothetical protein